MNQDLSTLEPAPAPPVSSDQEAAYLLALAMGDTSVSVAEALDTQRLRVAALRDPTSDRSLGELSRQLPVLESLFHRLAADALQAKSPTGKAILLKAALQAQQAHARTFALLRGLALQAKGLAVVTLEADPGTAGA